MPQTRDHLAVLNFVNARGGCIVISKADLVDQETIELAEMEIREVMEGSFLEGKQVLPFSATEGRGLQEILMAAESEAERIDGKAIQAPFRLWVDQVRSFPGFGTVASGTVLSGSIRRDDTVELLPACKEAKVRFLEVHHQRVEQAVAGQRVGLNLHSIALDDVNLGTVIATPGIVSPAGLLNAELSLLPKTRRPILNRQRIKLYLGTHCTNALVVMMENERLHPGETSLVQIRLQQPLSVLPGDPFVISPMNLHAVVGGGRILETPKEKFRKVKAEQTLNYLQPLQKGDVKTIVRLYLLKFSSRPVTAEEIISATGFPAEKINAEIKSRTRAGKLVDLSGRGYFDRSRFEQLKKKLVDVTTRILSRDAFKSAASGDEIRFQLDPNLDDTLFDRMIQELCKDGKLTKIEKGYRIPNFVVKLPSHREKLIEQLLDFAKKQGYLTFSPGTFKKLYGQNFTYSDVERVINHLHAQKKLVRLNDGRFLTTEAMQEIREKVRDIILRKGSLTIHESREVLGFGRSRAIPIFDYLDSIGLTCRVGDIRVLSQEERLMPNTGRM